MHEVQLLPYNFIIGQDNAKLALELMYIMPANSGVLISGQRGTGKSTLVRAFCNMIYGQLPVTIPINVTEDRVVGGWDVHKLLAGETDNLEQMGLLEEANGRILYIDEINLLDDHIVNIILDPVASGGLHIQREGRDNIIPNITFKLVGTMNPEEGGLRPQLLDRFSLMVDISSSREKRLEILQKVLEFDQAVYQSEHHTVMIIEESHSKDEQRRQILESARLSYYEVQVGRDILHKSIEISDQFEIDGHRGEKVMIQAAQAYAALCHIEKNTELTVTHEHLSKVVRMSIQHRRRQRHKQDDMVWSKEDEQLLKDLMPDEPSRN